MYTFDLLALVHQMDGAYTLELLEHLNSVKPTHTQCTKLEKSSVYIPANTVPLLIRPLPPPHALTETHLQVLFATLSL